MSAGGARRSPRGARARRERGHQRRLDRGLVAGDQRLDLAVDWATATGSGSRASVASSVGGTSGMSQPIDDTAVLA